MIGYTVLNEWFAALVGLMRGFLFDTWTFFVSFGYPYLGGFRRRVGFMYSS